MIGQQGMGQFGCEVGLSGWRKEEKRAFQIHLYKSDRFKKGEGEKKLEVNLGG